MKKYQRKRETTNWLATLLAKGFGALGYWACAARYRLDLGLDVLLDEKKLITGLFGLWTAQF